MSAAPEFHTVHPSINRSLTIWGAERGLFFLGLVMGGAVFNFFGSLLGGFVMFAGLFWAARWATVTDPQILRVVLNSAKFRARYDPAKSSEPAFVRELKP